MRYTAKSEKVDIEGFIDIPEKAVGITFIRLIEEEVDNFEHRVYSESIVAQWLEPMD